MRGYSRQNYTQLSQETTVVTMVSQVPLQLLIGLEVYSSVVEYSPNIYKVLDWISSTGSWYGERQGAAIKDSWPFWSKPIRIWRKCIPKNKTKQNNPEHRTLKTPIRLTYWIHLYVFLQNPVAKTKWSRTYKKRSDFTAPSPSASQGLFMTYNMLLWPLCLWVQ